MMYRLQSLRLTDKCQGYSSGSVADSWSLLMGCRYQERTSYTTMTPCWIGMYQQHKSGNSLDLNSMCRWDTSRYQIYTLTDPPLNKSLSSNSDTVMTRSLRYWRRRFPPNTVCIVSFLCWVHTCPWDSSNMS